MIALPADLPVGFNLTAFSSDGTAVYGQSVNPRHRKGLIKIEFGPTRQTLVPGSMGLGEISHLTVGTSGIIFVSGSALVGEKWECGTFKVDPVGGTFWALRAGICPDDGGAGGAISPDGKRVLSYGGKQLGVLNLSTGTLTVIKLTGKVSWPSGCAWSPDGRWISVIHDDQIVLIEADNFDSRRRLGASGRGPAFWSPDSRYLLLSKSQWSCSSSLYFSSLETIDVESGERKLVTSSHCSVAIPTVGWMDMKVVR